MVLSTDTKRIFVLVLCCVLIILSLAALLTNGFSVLSGVLQILTLIASVFGAYGVIKRHYQLLLAFEIVLVCLAILGIVDIIVELANNVAIGNFLWTLFITLIIIFGSVFTDDLRKSDGFHGVTYTNAMVSTHGAAATAATTDSSSGDTSIPIGSAPTSSATSSESSPADTESETTCLTDIPLNSIETAPGAFQQADVPPVSNNRNLFGSLKHSSYSAAPTSPGHMHEHPVPVSPNGDHISVPIATF